MEISCFRAGRFVGCQQISLRRKRRKPRGAQMAVVETPEGLIHLVNWHLGLAERERHWQVRHLLDHAFFRESAHLPTLIAGDFNDWLNTLARGPFASHGFVQVTAPEPDSGHSPLTGRSFRSTRPLCEARSRFATRGSSTPGSLAKPLTTFRWLSIFM